MSKQITQPKQVIGIRHGSHPEFQGHKPTYLVSSCDTQAKHILNEDSRSLLPQIERGWEPAVASRMLIGKQNDSSVHPEIPPPSHTSPSARTPPYCPILVAQTQPAGLDAMETKPVVASLDPWPIPLREDPPLSAQSLEDGVIATSNDIPARPALKRTFTEYTVFSVAVEITAANHLIRGEVLDQDTPVMVKSPRDADQESKASSNRRLSVTRHGSFAPDSPSNLHENEHRILMCRKLRNVLSKSGTVDTRPIHRRTNPVSLDIAGSYEENDQDSSSDSDILHGSKVSDDDGDEWVGKQACYWTRATQNLRSRQRHSSRRFLSKCTLLHVFPSSNWGTEWVSGDDESEDEQHDPNQEDATSNLPAPTAWKGLPNTG